MWRQLCACQSHKPSRAIHRVTYSSPARLKAGRVGWLVSHPGSRGGMGRFTASALVCLSPEGMVGGFPPPLECLPTQGCWFLGALCGCRAVSLPRSHRRSAWVSLLSGEAVPEHACAPHFWRGGEVLEAGTPPEGLANTCSVAVLQGPVMNKQLDKLLVFFPVSECWYCNTHP